MAQNKTSTTTKDSINIIVLNEVNIKGLIANQDTHIKDFFIANKASTTEDILSRLSEINMIRRGSYGTEPLIRSYGTGQVNLMIDGMRMHGACTDKMDPVSIYVEPQNLQRIQVETVHGCKAGSTIGGTINLKLAAPDCDCPTPFSGYISSGYQTAAKAFYESGYLNFNNNKWAIRANITYRKASDYRSGEGNMVPYSYYEKLNYGLSAIYKLSNKWQIKTDLLLDDGWNIGYPALPMDVGYAGAKIGSLSLMKLGGISKWINTEFKVYGNSIDHAMDDTHRKNVAMHMDMPGTSKTIGGYMGTTFRWSNRKQLQIRADVSSTDLYASMTMYQAGQTPMYMLTWPNNNSIQTGISATYFYNPDSLSVITISSRIDEFINSLSTQEAKNQVSGMNRPTDNINQFLKNLSVGYNYRFTKHFKASASVAYAERMPTSTELYGIYLFNAFDNYDYLGNTLLKPENAWKADLNFIYQSSDIQVSLTTYFSRVNNYILGVYQSGLSTMTMGANGVKNFENIPFALIAGLEAGIIYKAANNTEVISTIKYTYGADNNNNSLALIAPFKNINSIRKQLKKWSVQGDAEWATAQNRISETAKESATKAFATFNVRSSYSDKLFRKMFRIDFGIENIFDAVYKEHLDWGTINRPGRNGYVQLSVLL